MYRPPFNKKQYEKGLENISTKWKEKRYNKILNYIENKRKNYFECYIGLVLPDDIRDIVQENISISDCEKIVDYMYRKINVEEQAIIDTYTLLKSKGDIK